jgi:hypothetical protein
VSVATVNETLQEYRPTVTLTLMDGGDDVAKVSITLRADAAKRPGTGDGKRLSESPPVKPRG